MHVGLKVRNCVSGKIEIVEEVSPVPGWFRTAGEKGWTHCSYYQPLVPKVKEG